MKTMDSPCKFCRQRNEFLEIPLGISSSMSCPNLEEKPVTITIHIQFQQKPNHLLLDYSKNRHSPSKTKAIS